MKASKQCNLNAEHLGGRVFHDNCTAFCRVFRADSNGALVVNACAVAVSLKNRAERERLRRLALTLLWLASDTDHDIGA